jgi:hypothetical protein
MQGAGIAPEQSANLNESASASMKATVAKPSKTKNDATSRRTDPPPAPHSGSTARKNADDRSGDEAMTAAQATHLKALAEQAREPEAFSSRLTKAEASKRIEALEAKLKLMDGPPHTL